jgi:GTP pyrophosphokinase
MVSTVLQNSLDLTTRLERFCQNKSIEECLTLTKTCHWLCEWANESQLENAYQLIDLLEELQADVPTLIAAVAYKWLDNSLSEKEISQICGEHATNLMIAMRKMAILHDLPILTDSKVSPAQNLENIRKMLLSILDDPRTVLIKLAERLIEMRHIREFEIDYQRNFAQQTLEIFAPLANRLGIGRLKWELEDLSLRTLESETYATIAKSLENRRVEREIYLQNIMQVLSEKLQTNHIQGEISGRPKHIYSIWRKMQKKNLDISRVFDSLAIRVMVNSTNECYSILGLVHNLWEPLPSEFDDYIAAPKANGYKSLHTAVIGPEDKKFEVQIRTFEMHRLAESGDASHWRYKEGIKQDQSLEKKIATLRDFLNGEQLTEIPDDTVIYVLTPKGKVLQLLLGSTPLDFAYHIHTSLGHRCRGAKINQRIVPLNTPLQNGDEVEILTAKEERPSRDWLNAQLHYVQTTSAKQKIRLWLQKQELNQHISEGRTLLERELRRLNLKETSWEELGNRLQCKNAEHLCAEIGRGNITTDKIASAIKEWLFPSAKPAIKARQSHQNAGNGGILSFGVDGLLTHTARCCSPVPGDKIVGFITKGKGISVHREDCNYVKRWNNQEQQRLISVEWQHNDKAIYPVDISLLCDGRSDILAQAAQVVTECKLRMTAHQSNRDKQQELIKIIFRVEVNHAEQLSILLHRLEELPNVVEASRMKSA